MVGSDVKNNTPHKKRTKDLHNHDAIFRISFFIYGCYEIDELGLLDYRAGKDGSCAWV